MAAIPGSDKDLFERALQVVLPFEGGRAPAGPLNPRTAFGVTQPTYDAWRRSKKLKLRDVWLITPEEYVEIYYNLYWTPAKCSTLVFWPMAVVHLDAAINSGVVQSILTIQRALRVKVDGAFGPITTKAASLAGPLEAYRLLLERMIYYIHLDDAHPERLQYFNSWLRRLELLYKDVEVKPLV